MILHKGRQIGIQPSAERIMIDDRNKIVVEINAVADFSQENQQLIIKDPAAF